MTLLSLSEWLASILTLLSVYKYGDGGKWGPYWGLASQVFWWYLCLGQGLYGLVPLNLAMLCVHVRNLWRLR